MVVGKVVWWIMICVRRVCVCQRGMYDAITCVCQAAKSRVVSYVILDLDVYQKGYV